MARVTFTDLGGVTGGDPDKMVGITDLELVETSQGSVLYATGRGGLYLTSIDVGTGNQSSTVTEEWRIPTSYLQIESVEIVHLPTPQGDGVYFAGLNADEMIGRHVDGDDIRYAVSLDAGSFDMANVSGIDFAEDGSGIASLRTGGVVQIDYVNGALEVQSVPMGGGLVDARVSDVEVFEANGTTYAVATYGQADALALFEVQPDGRFIHVQDVEAGDGLWVDSPGAVATITGLDGEAYVIVASSGSSSLTVLQVSDGVMTPVDHRIDGLETRFDDASFVQTVEIGGRPYVVAAGSDMGVTVFGLMPGGSLVEIGSVAATADTPINGIMDLEVIPQGDDAARFVIATQGAPYIVEFEMSFDAQGVTRLGNNSANTLNGGNGDDWLFGEGGNDTINGGAGDDLITDGAGEDVLSGGSGADVFQLYLDGSNDTITDFNPEEDIIEIMGIPIGDMDLVDLKIRWWGIEITINGELFSVYSEGGGGIPWSAIQGGALVFSEAISVDVTDYAFAGPDYGPEDGSDLNATLGMGPYPDRPDQFTAPQFSDYDVTFVLASRDADELTLNNLAQAINGQGGGDMISGMGGSDTILGGNGFDTIYGGNGNDRISGDANADSIFGDAGNDWITGGSGFDQLDGGAGNDMIWGGSSPDRINGGDGDDYIRAGTNFGGSVDGVDGGAGNDTLFGDGGFDLLIGGLGDDVLDGGKQADRLLGEEGNDTILGGDGSDRMWGGTGSDVIAGGNGDERIFGGHGHDTIWADAGTDKVFAGSGADAIHGGAGNDTLKGDAGADTIFGGTGDDVMWGGIDADRFVFTNGHGDDVISDFDAGSEAEVLDFSALSAFGTTSDVMEAAVQDGGDVVIDTGEGSIRLVGVSLGDLDGTDFLF